ncbi:MAG TPA: protein kinase, partial [Kofleriaceae bacterium]|nr:protein kinase [Kofleriaceae bacterium]
VLDRYRVVEQIASGGHSVVFRGQDERLSRPVCIKVFSGLGGQSGVGRTSYEHFVQEAFALSRLTHPNTLRIYDFGHVGAKDEAGMPLQICEYMNGGTLSNIIREQGKQSLVETARIVTAMCLALAEAHALGIVHRDIKPQNILFGAVGANKLPKLADFGIAKWSADDAEKGDNRAEDTAIVAGQKLAMYSPSWAAPEQLAGQPVSPATDIYSLACVAVYMLSAKAIFADEDVYAGYKKRRHADELVREALVPLNVPKPVIRLLGRALAFDPKQRVSKVEELVSEMGAALEPSTDEQPRIPKRPHKPNDPTAPLSAITPMTPTNPIDSVTPIGTKPATLAPEYTDPPAVPTAAAPTPPAIPRSQSPSYVPPSVTQPWMTNAKPASGMPHRLQLSDVPVMVGDRRVHFVMVPKNVADLVGSQGSRVRVTLLPGPTGARIVHVKGLTCFVAHLGGRPSPAVQIEHASDIALVTPRAQEIGHIRVATGSPGLGQIVFPIGAELASISLDDCADSILFDFGPGSDAYFVYTRGRTIPKSKGRG